MEFVPIETQEALNAIIQERVKRAVPADYDELKTKAAKLDKIEKANQTAMDEVLARLQKSDERAEASEKSAAAAAFAAKRSAIQAKHKVSDEDAALFLTGTDEAALVKQAKALEERASNARTRGNFVPSEGSNPPAPSTEMADFTSQLFGRGA